MRRLVLLFLVALVFLVPISAPIASASHGDCPLPKSDGLVVTTDTSLYASQGIITVNVYDSHLVGSILAADSPYDSPNVNGVILSTNANGNYAQMQVQRVNPGAWTVYYDIRRPSCANYNEMYVPRFVGAGS